MNANHSVFSAMAATASRVLAEYGDQLPEVASVDIRPTYQGSHPPQPQLTISLQSQAEVGREVADVARWADLFGGPVRLIRNDSYVQVSARFEVDGHQVVAWDHITPERADTLAAALGKRLDTVLDIAPGALRALS